MNPDEKLQRILQAEVDTIEPSPAGWNRIKDGIAARRRRRVWLRSSAAATAALSLVAVVALQAGRDTSANRPNEIDVATQEPGPDATAAPAPDSTTSIAVWPLTTEAEVAAWKRDPVGFEFLGDRGSTALHFAREYLGIKEPALDTSGDRIVVKRRAEGAAEPLYVGTLDITGGGDRPYLVTGMSADGITVTSPTAGSVVPRVVTVRGTFAGADQVIDVELRTAASAGGRTIAKSRAQIGPEGWTATLEYVSTAARTGSLLVTTDSGLDGGLAGSVAQPVGFTTGSAAPAPAATPQQADDGVYPAQFVAVERNRIGVYETKTGRRVRFLTEQLPGGGATDPSVTPDGRHVIYVQGAGTCAAEIRRVPVAGGPPELLRQVGGDRVPTYPVLSSQNDLAYVETSCGGDRPPRIVIQRAPSPSTSNERVVEGEQSSTILGLSWSRDGSTLAAVLVRFSGSGDDTSVREVEVGTRSIGQARVLAGPDTSGRGCSWRDTAAPSSKLVAVRVCGNGESTPPLAEVVELTDGGERVFTTFEGRYATRLTATRSGDHLLFETRTADDVAAVYRFSVDGDPIKVADGLTQPEWIE